MVSQRYNAQIQSQMVKRDVALKEAKAKMMAFLEARTKLGDERQSLAKKINNFK